MDESKHIQTIVAALEDKTDYRHISEQLHHDPAEIAEYNAQILNALKYRDTSFQSSVKLSTFLENDSTESFHREPRVDTVGIDMRMTKEILKEFYQIEACPSFLCYDAMLEKEDFEFMIEIYSNAYNLKYR